LELNVIDTNAFKARKVFDSASLMGVSDKLSRTDVGLIVLTQFLDIAAHGLGRTWITNETQVVH
jgi:hypothetical protein